MSNSNCFLVCKTPSIFHAIFCPPLSTNHSATFVLCTDVYNLFHPSPSQIIMSLRVRCIIIIMRTSLWLLCEHRIGWGFLAGLRR